VNINNPLTNLLGKLRALLFVRRASNTSENSLDISTDRRNVTPRHVAIIMDGNNRWARERKVGAGVSGHRAGVEAIRGVLKGCEKNNVEVLTLFAFSSENWLRPKVEVDELMSLFEDYLDSEASELHEQGIRLCFIGRRDRLKSSLTKKMQQAETLTSTNVKRVLVLAVDYGGRWDITQACQQAVREALLQQQESTLDIDRSVAELAVDEVQFGKHMSLADFPELDLCIRTGGEYRISNFLLWQCSYAELYFTECYWPDFDEEEFSSAVATYASRQRRFGRTSEQLAAEVDTSGAKAGLGRANPDGALKSSTHA